METSQIERGAPVIAVNAFGEGNHRIALTSVIAGQDFPVVWICREEEWDAAIIEGREAEGIPFPAEDVTLATIDA